MGADIETGPVVENGHWRHVCGGICRPVHIAHWQLSRRGRAKTQAGGEKRNRKPTHDNSPHTLIQRNGVNSKHAELSSRLSVSAKILTHNLALCGVLATF